MTLVRGRPPPLGLLPAALGRGRLPASDAPSALAGAFEGMGLVIGTGLAASGATILLYAVEGQKLAGWLHDVGELHEALGPLMWAYLGVHGAAALGHHVSGHGHLAAMVRFWRRDGAGESAPR